MYIKGLLLNNKLMTGDRLHNMLKMLSEATGGSTNKNSILLNNSENVFNYNMNITQLKNYLNTLIDKEIIEYVDGSYQLMKK